MKRYSCTFLTGGNLNINVNDTLLFHFLKDLKQKKFVYYKYSY